MSWIQLRPASSSSSPKRDKRRPNAHPLLLFAVLLATVLIAGCGSSSTTHATAARTADHHNSKPRYSLQAYARCMRTHGVPSFKLSASPTGSSGNGGGGNKQSPYGSPTAPMRAVQAAHKACERYEPPADRG